MNIDFIKSFIFQYGLTILPIIVSILGVLYSVHVAKNSAKESARLSKEANQLAREAHNKSEKQFIESTRPQLTAEPYRFQNTNSYFQMSKIDDSKIHASVCIVVQNKGNVVASSANIEEATFQIGYGGSRIAYARNFYDNLGRSYPSKENISESNFTLIDVLPHSGFVRKLEFIIDLSDTKYTTDRIFDLQPNLAITINLRAICGYEQIKGKQFITHTSHAITKDSVTVLEHRIGVYDTPTS